MPEPKNVYDYNERTRLLEGAHSVDKAVQEYLRSKRYDLVEVFCSGDPCRNNTGGWPMRAGPCYSSPRAQSSSSSRPRKWPTSWTRVVAISSSNSARSTVARSRLRW